MDFLKIYNSLNFLTESIRLQYSNFIFKHQKKLNSFLTFDDVINRLRLEEPIEYIFNSAEFCDLEFYIDKRCLIPRPETQEIIQRTIDFVSQNPYKSFTIIDTGTGSGCIILSLAHKLKKSQKNKFKFIGIDISNEALEVAKINREALDLKDNVELIESDFREFDFSKHQNLIICSNLPYIPDTEKLQKSVKEFEPHLALFGGEKGDELNNELLEMVKDLKNLRAIFMEGENGEITCYKTTH